MHNKKPILAFDFDDTLVDVTRNFIDFCKKNKKLIVNYEEIETDIASLLKITEEKELELWDKFFESKEYLSITPTTQQLETLTKIKEKFDPIILTSRANRFRQSLIKWVEKHLAGYFSEIIFCADFPKEKQTKGAICSKLKVQMLIDDESKNIISCLDYNIPVIIYDCPWNRKLNKKIPRVKSLKETEKLLIQ
jgi:5'(3')-deoxyribonucleotidase